MLQRYFLSGMTFTIQPLANIEFLWLLVAIAPNALAFPLVSYLGSVCVD